MLMLEMGNPSTGKRLVGGYSMSGFLGFGSSFDHGKPLSITRPRGWRHHEVKRNLCHELRAIHGEPAGFNTPCREPSISCFWSVCLIVGSESFETQTSRCNQTCSAISQKGKTPLPRSRSVVAYRYLLERALALGGDFASGTPPIVPGVRAELEKPAVSVFSYASARAVIRQVSAVVFSRTTRVAHPNIPVTGLYQSTWVSRSII